MLQTLDALVLAHAKPVSHRTWLEIPTFLESEVSVGASKSSTTKTRSAANSLLKAKKLTADNAYIDLQWFDATFPPDGWDPVDMKFEQATYLDYRHRVRPVLERMLGAPAQTTVVPTDSWTEAADAIADLEFYSGPHGRKKLIPFTSTLTNAARRVGLRTTGLNQETLLALHADAQKSERLSLRTASGIIATAQQMSPVIAQLLPHKIEPIEAEGPFRYNVPAHLEPEIEKFVEIAARKKYIRVKKIYEYLKKGTRIGMETTMRAVVDALIATGHLDPEAREFGNLLSKIDALLDVLGHITRRVEASEITARHATTLVSRLPTILKRNDFDVSDLRAAIKEVDELCEYADDAGMTEKTKRLCRKLIENRSYRNKFLLAHARPRQVAQEILNVARAEARSLTPNERATVIRHGTVALFCALEIGGAPVRVENVTGMPFGGRDAWIRPKDAGFEVLIPGAFVKNGEEIRFEMMPEEHRFTDTVHWYLTEVRPLILLDPDTDPNSDKIRTSPWLIPMRRDVSRPCPYATFHSWFVRIMRDVVGVPCTPHNFRHGQASLLYHYYPEDITWIAQRLGDTPETVLQQYVWVHKEKAMANGQRRVAEMIKG